MQGETIYGLNQVISDTVDTELKYYLLEKPIPVTEDALDWWGDKIELKQYPGLIQLAREYLYPPATSVASESLWSKAGQAMTKYRTMLSEKMLNETLFLAFTSNKPNFSKKINLFHIFLL